MTETSEALTRAETEISSDPSATNLEPKCSACGTANVAPPHTPVKHENPSIPFLPPPNSREPSYVIPSRPVYRKNGALDDRWFLVTRGLQTGVIQGW